MSDEVSVEEAREMIDGGSVSIAEAVSAGFDLIDSATCSGRYGVAVHRAGELLNDVERLARTVLALHERHAAEVAQARREGAEAMRESVQGVLRARRRAADDLADEQGDEDEGYAFQVVGELIEVVATLALPGAEVSRG